MIKLDEEAAKPCIQDRLRSIISRARYIFASWPIICLTILILIIITLPEILTLTIGREVIIPILSQISLESRFTILFSFSVALFSSLQYKINKSLLMIEEQRIKPRLYAEIEEDEEGFIRKILIKNRGGGIAYFCNIDLFNGDSGEEYFELIEEIDSWSAAEIEMPEEWLMSSFDLYIAIKYYTKKKIHPDFQLTWSRLFKYVKPRQRF